MRPLFRRYLALTLGLLTLASPACLLTAPAGSEMTSLTPPDGTTTLVLDYTGTLNCESDLWNDESYGEPPTPPKD